jgi:proteic killer suppression protein
MRVGYGKGLAAYLSQESACKGRYGAQMARVIFRRLNQLHAAPTLEAMRDLGRCHELKGDYIGRFALDLVHPHRLIFRPVDEAKAFLDGNSISWGKVVEVEILEITDYH